VDGRGAPRSAALIGCRNSAAAVSNNLYQASFCRRYHSSVDAVLAALELAAEGTLMPSGSSILLAVSGGADSMALLVGAAELAPRFDWRLAVGHVHHGWRGEAADKDLAFVGDWARRLGLPFASRRREAREEARRLGLSPEAGARHVRYGALHEMAGELHCGLIATAHQREDRIESYLLARQRRLSPLALAGPRARRQDGVVRPLLAVSRREILHFLGCRGICFRRDATNGDLLLPRNRLRRALALRTLERGEPILGRLAARVEALARRRDRLERDFDESVRPLLTAGPGAVLADAARLAQCPPELARLALDEAARLFARPGRPPMTGREREQVLARLAEGGNFRFEAGRRIRFERRGGTLTVRPA
jgi:tRNA(Ile)-lysidine synthetase-like protein